MPHRTYGSQPVELSAIFNSTNQLTTGGQKAPEEGLTMPENRQTISDALIAMGDAAFERKMQDYRESKATQEVRDDLAFMRFRKQVAENAKRETRSLQARWRRLAARFGK